MRTVLPDELRQLQTGTLPLSARLSALRAGAEIAVEIVAGQQLSGLDDAWRDLLLRSDLHNVFMAPALLSAAAQAGTPVLALLAWQGEAGDRRLAGIWAFSAGRPRGALLPFKVLRAPAMDHGYLATPVIDRNCVETALAAMLDALASAPGLPKTALLSAMGADAADALQRVVAARAAHVCMFNETQRPALAASGDPDAYLQTALSTSTRKKLRQYRRRLGERGDLQLRVAQTAEDIAKAADDFLTLEAQGWKGRRGTALLSRPQDAAFTRTMLQALAREGQACVYSLALDERPVSMQIVLRAGTTAFTWKTAYDEALGDLSPGMLLFEDYTKALLADRDIVKADSCAYDDQSFMASWSERERVVDMMFDVRRNARMRASLAASVNCAYRALRARAKTHWHRGRALLKNLRKSLQMRASKPPLRQQQADRSAA